MHFREHDYARNRIVWDFLNGEMTPFEKALVREKIETIKFNSIPTKPVTDRRKRRAAKKARKG